jgi:hypothetical protein
MSVARYSWNLRSLGLPLPFSYTSPNLPPTFPYPYSVSLLRILRVPPRDTPCLGYPFAEDGLRIMCTLAYANPIQNYELIFS